MFHRTSALQYGCSFHKYLKGLIGARQSIGYGDVAMNNKHNLYPYRRSTVMWGEQIIYNTDVLCRYKIHIDLFKPLRSSIIENKLTTIIMIKSVA